MTAVAAGAELFDRALADLADLVAIPSVSAAGFDPERVRESASATAELLAAAGAGGVRLLEVDGAHPAVFGEIPAPPGAPTVLLYAHHDVQPPGDVTEWHSDPFTLVERDGRLYGRGACDDKCGIVVHATTLRAFAGRPPVGIKLFIEGEEETGSVHLGDFLDEYGGLLAADAVVVADSGNWRIGTPALTRSLRGLVDCVVEVRTAADGVHSGMFGGAVPDALTALCRLLAGLHRPDGEVAVPGLRSGDAPPLDLTEDELRRLAGVEEGVTLLGAGSLTARLWNRPAVSVLAIDAPPVREAINQLVPVARAKVSMRIAPGQSAAGAMAALVEHLEAGAPWGATVTVTPGSAGEPCDLPLDGPVATAFRAGLAEAWERDPVEIGVGGSIPFVADVAARFPAAEFVLTGAADPSSRAHGPNESVDRIELRRAILAQIAALERVSG